MALTRKILQTIFKIFYIAGVTLWLWAAIFVLVLSFLIILSINGFPLPNMFKAKLSNHISTLSGYPTHIEKLVFDWSENWEPILRLQQTKMHQSNNLTLSLDRLDILMERSSLISFSPKLKAITGHGLTINAHHNENNAFQEILATDENSTRQNNPATEIEKLEQLANTPYLSTSISVKIHDITFSHSDKNTEEKWPTINGLFMTKQTPTGFIFDTNFSFLDKNSQQTDFTMAVEYSSALENIHITQNFKNIPIHDLLKYLNQPALSDNIQIYADGAVNFALSKNATLENIAGHIDINPDNYTTAPYLEEKLKEAFLKFSYLPEQQKISIDALKFSSTHSFLNGTGFISFGQKNPFSTPISARINMNEMAFVPNNFLRSKIHTKNATFNARAEKNFANIILEQSKIPIDGSVIKIQGAAEKRLEGWEGHFSTAIDSTNVHLIKKYWPKNIKKGALKWITNNVPQAQLTDVNATLHVLPLQKPDITLNFDFANTEIVFIPHFEPLRQARGYGLIKNEQFHLFIDKGHVDAGANRKMQIRNTKVLLDKLSILNNPVEIHTEISGSFPDALHFLNKPPFNLIDKQGIALDAGTGDVYTNSKINFRIKKKLSYKDVSFKVVGHIQNLDAKKLIVDRHILIPMVKIDASQKFVKFNGIGTFDNIPFDMFWQQNIDADTAQKNFIKGTTKISPSTIKSLGLPLENDIIFGQTTGNLAIEINPDSATNLSLTSNLDGLGGQFKPLGWYFDKKAKGTFNIDATLTPHLDIKQFEIQAGTLKIKGHAHFSEDLRLTKLTLETLKLGNKIDIKANILPKNTNETAKIEIQGSYVDIDAFKNTDTKEVTNFEKISITLDKLKVTPHFIFDDFKGEFNGSDNFSGDFSVHFLDRQFLITKNNQKLGSCYTIRSQIMRGMQSNYIRMKLSQNKKNNIYNGHLNIESIKVQNLPIATEILSTLSIVGLLEKMANNGIVFRDIDVYFTLDNDKITIISAYMFNPSLSIYADGIVDLKNNFMDLQLIIAPFFIFNGIGGILTGSQQGIFGFQVNLDGEITKPNIVTTPMPHVLPGTFTSNKSKNKISCDADNKTTP